MTTTQGNKITAVMAYMGQELNMKDRKVFNSGAITHVMLHDKICLSIDRYSKSLIIDGNTPPTRKSVKLINTILETTDARVATEKGRWKLTIDNKTKDFSGAAATVNISEYRCPKKCIGILSLANSERIIAHPYKGKQC